MFDEEAEYEKCDKHKKFCAKAFAHNEEIDVNACLEGLELEAIALFTFDIREVTKMVQSLIDTL